MNVPKSTFDLSHDRKLTGKMGKLIPIFLEEIMPGDYFKVASSMMVRLTPLVAPIMHRVNVFTHFFFVPTRLVWDDFPKFYTGGKDGDDTTVWPHIVTGGLTAGSLADYLGLPIGTPASSLKVSAIPFRAVNLIWNEWYRDQNLQTERVISKASGLDTTTDLTLPVRCWEKDYFTCALPWAQRGNPVTLPIGDSAPIEYVTGQYPKAVQGTGADSPASAGISIVTSGRLWNDTQGAPWAIDPDGSLVADLSNATASTINDIRLAVTIQRFFEAAARGGARLVETILQQFGVRSSDQRLQRPEYLGGGVSPVVVSEVLQHSETTVNSPQGTMAGHGFSLQTAHGFQRFFEEPGYVIGLLSVMPRTAYQQGVARHWSRETRFDYPWPAFAHIGEQAVLNKEIYADGDADPVNGDNGVFGYQGRYDELRHRESSVHGLFRKAPGDGGLDFWHMGRIFDSRPTLSAEFVAADPTTRISAVPDEDNCLIHVMHQVRAARPLPLRGEPGLTRF